MAGAEGQRPLPERKAGSAMLWLSSRLRHCTAQLRCNASRPLASIHTDFVPQAWAAMIPRSHEGNASGKSRRQLATDSSNSRPSDGDDQGAHLSTLSQFVLARSWPGNSLCCCLYSQVCMHRFAMLRVIPSGSGPMLRIDSVTSTFWNGN